jgi:hypothetical protein
LVPQIENGGPAEVAIRQVEGNVRFLPARRFTFRGGKMHLDGNPGNLPAFAHLGKPDIAGNALGGPFDDLDVPDALPWFSTAMAQLEAQFRTFARPEDVGRRIGFQQNGLEGGDITQPQLGVIILHPLASLHLRKGRPCQCESQACD